MTLNLFLIFGAAFFGFALVSKRIQGTIFTAPILFTLGGLLLSRVLMERTGLTYTEGGLHVLAELTLILVLAADASQISLSDLRKMKAIPIRLLTVALPLIIIIGSIVGYLISPESDGIRLRLSPLFWLRRMPLWAPRSWQIKRYL